VKVGAGVKTTAGVVGFGAGAGAVVGALVDDVEVVGAGVAGAGVVVAGVVAGLAPPYNARE